jgi:adenylate kinase
VAALGDEPGGAASAGDGSAPARVVLLGRQGSGKGTQAERLAAVYGVPHVSTGDAFRAAVKGGTGLGKTAQSYMERGELVPDDVVVGVVREHLFGPGSSSGFVLDGFPRNLFQAEALETMAAPRGIDVCVDLDVSTEEVLHRLSARRVCTNCGATYNLVSNPPKAGGRCDACGGTLYQRDDDTEEAIRRRLEIYEEETAPLIAWYKQRGLLASVDATGSPDDVAARVIAVVEGARARGKGGAS